MRQVRRVVALAIALMLVPSMALAQEPKEGPMDLVISSLPSGEITPVPCWLIMAEIADGAVGVECDLSELVQSGYSEFQFFNLNGELRAGLWGSEGFVSGWISDDSVSVTGQFDGNGAVPIPRDQPYDVLLTCRPSQAAASHGFWCVWPGTELFAGYWDVLIQLEEDIRSIYVSSPGIGSIGVQIERDGDPVVSGRLGRQLDHQAERVNDTDFYYWADPVGYTMLDCWTWSNRLGDFGACEFDELISAPFNYGTIGLGLEPNQYSSSKCGDRLRTYAIFGESHIWSDVCETGYHGGDSFRWDPQVTSRRYKYVEPVGAEAVCAIYSSSYYHAECVLADDGPLDGTRFFLAQHGNHAAFSSRYPGLGWSAGTLSSGEPIYAGSFYPR